MSNFSHLFEYDERDTQVPIPTDNILMHEHSLDKSLKDIATYQMDDYFMKLHDLNKFVENRFIVYHDDDDQLDDYEL